MRTLVVLAVGAGAPLAIGGAGATLAACGSDSTSTPANGADASNPTSGDATTNDAQSNVGNDGATTNDASSDGADGATVDTDGGADASLCPSGSALLRDKTTCAATAPSAPGAFADASAAAGDVVSMAGLSEGTLPCAPAAVCVPNGAATMLFSDDPESPTADGVLYADTVGPGRFRIYVYHANGGAAPRKFPVVVLNQNGATAHVTLRKKGVGAAGTDYVAIGKSVAAQWMDSNLSTAIDVPSQTRILLDADLDAVHTNKNDLAHAIFDLDVDTPVKISVVSLLVAEDAATATAGLSLLPDDALHDRGTFPNADLLFVSHTGGEGAVARNIRLGDGTTEPELPGTDATTGKARTLGGNYGVFYTFQIASAGGASLALSPRGGDWGGVAQPQSGATAVLMPSASTSLASTTSAVWLGTYAPGTIHATMVSAGGSNLPTDLVILAK